MITNNSISNNPGFNVPSPSLSVGKRGEAGVSVPSDSVEIQGKSSLKDKIMDIIYVGADIAREIVAGGKVKDQLVHGAKFTLTGLSRVATVGTGIAGAYIGVKGALGMKTAIKEQDKIGMVESAGELALAGSAGIQVATEVSLAATTAGTAGPIASFIASSSVLTAVGTGLGVVYGATEIISGVSSIRDGIKGKNKKEILAGVLDTAIGLGAIGLCATGGLPLAIGLGAAYIVRMMAFDQRDEQRERVEKVKRNKMKHP